jgi:hypothetical protein
MPKPKSSARTPAESSISAKANPQSQLDSFLAKYNPEIADFARRAQKQMRKLIPGAIEMVYDNYNALVIGFGPSDRASEAIFSIVLYPRHVSLCFLQGVALPDPARRLQGSGNVVRFIRLYDAGKPDPKTLNDPEVRALVNLALNRAKVLMPKASRRMMIIKSISVKQRPRRPGK